MHGLLLLALLQVPVDQDRIDAAIRKGLAFLDTAPSPSHSVIAHADELILYTFIVAGVPETDARFQKLLQRVLAETPTHTYRVTLQAMLLEELGRVKYQDRIATCAQFLVDNQCQNGQWAYGEPTVSARDDNVASGGAAREVPAGTGKPGVRRKIFIRPQRTGPPEGDNSNSQYAALGLRACHDAGVVIPEGTIRRALRWWESTIVGDKKGERPAIASGGIELPQGWGYKKGEEPYNTMTAGGAGCIAIYDHLQKRDGKKNPKARSALAWLGAHYWLNGPPKGATPFWFYYYLYGIERVGILFDSVVVGGKDWYFDGTRWLLEQQNVNGTWDQNKLYSNPSNAPYDTCFAILFLKKATRALTPTTDPFGK